MSTSSRTSSLPNVTPGFRSTNREVDVCDITVMRLFHSFHIGTHNNKQLIKLTRNLESSIEIIYVDKSQEM